MKAFRWRGHNYGLIIRQAPRRLGLAVRFCHKHGDSNQLSSWYCRHKRSVVRYVSVLDFDDKPRLHSVLQVPRPEVATLDNEGTIDCIFFIIMKQETSMMQQNTVASKIYRRFGNYAHDTMEGERNYSNTPQ